MDYVKNNHSKIESCFGVKHFSVAPAIKKVVKITVLDGLKEKKNVFTLI